MRRFVRRLAATSTGVAAAFLVFMLAFVFATPFGFCASGHGSGSQAALAEAERLRIGQDAGWRKRLLYAGRILGSDKSLISSPEFFLAGPAGQTDSDAELSATIQAFFTPLGDVKDPDQHPQCVFPARFAWLDRRINFSRFGLPQAPCPALKRFGTYATYTGASLVFSNYFLNAPPSMFGHTLLVLHRQSGSGTLADSYLLDDAINFAAQVPLDINPVEYVLRGLLGLFQGKFSMTPYYQKIREYNDSESRDLWEMKLNLSAEDTTQLALFLYELSPTHVDYYFLTRNCSLMLLYVFEALNPAWNLVDRGTHTLYTIPSDTVRALADEDLIVGSTLRPAILTRYLRKLETLGPVERDTLAQLSAANASLSGALSALPDDTSRAKVLDAAIELADFNLGQSQDLNNPTETSLTRRRLSYLNERAKLPSTVRSDEAAAKAYSSPPYTGHPSTWLGVGASLATSASTRADIDPALTLHYRPALHDFLAKPDGYSDSMQLRVFDTTLAVRQSSLALDSWKLLEITSLAEGYFLIPATAWRFDAGIQQLPLWTWDPDDTSQALPPPWDSQVYLRIGRGLARRLGSSRLFGLLNARTGYSDAFESPFIGPEIDLGATWRPHSDLRFLAEGAIRYLWDLNSKWHASYLATLSAGWAIRPGIEVTTSLEAGGPFESSRSETYTKLFIGLRHYE